MQESIKVNEYVRTKKGIDKIKNINFSEDFPYSFNEYELYKYEWLIYDEDIVKHSYNIIELIEEGDVLILWDREYDEQYKSEVFLSYDNKLCVTNFEKAKILDLEIELLRKSIKIKAILTKQQFENNSYKVGV